MARKGMLDMIAPPGAGGPGPVGTEAIGTPGLEAAAQAPEPGARPAEGQEGQPETQNAIMQALAAGHGQQAGPQAGPPQLTPQDEAAIRMQLALAAKQRLVGGLGG